MALPNSALVARMVCLPESLRRMQRRSHHLPLADWVRSTTDQACPQLENRHRRTRVPAVVGPRCEPGAHWRLEVLPLMRTTPRNSRLQSRRCSADLWPVGRLLHSLFFPTNFVIRGLNDTQEFRRPGFQPRLRFHALVIKSRRYDVDKKVSEKVTLVARVHRFKNFEVSALATIAQTEARICCTAAIHASPIEGRQRC